MLSLSVPAELISYRTQLFLYLRIYKNLNFIPMVTKVRQTVTISQVFLNGQQVITVKSVSKRNLSGYALVTKPFIGRGKQHTTCSTVYPLTHGIVFHTSILLLI